MKIIYIVRHAKSSREDPNLPDHFRGLLPTGEKLTKKVAGHLRKRFINPELIITSSATRALKTAKIIAEELHYPQDQIIINASFYRAGVEEIMATLYNLPNEIEQIMIVGHNPALTDLVNTFLDDGHKIANLPSSAVAAIRFKTNLWEEIDKAKHNMEFLITPKEL